MGLVAWRGSYLRLQLGVHRKMWLSRRNISGPALRSARPRERSGLSEPWRGADGYFKHQGEQFLLRTNFYSFRFSFDAKASPQVSMTCLEPVEELE